jgi:hypothetical protein
MTGGIQSGEIAFAIFNGVLASLVVVWVFLALYRRAVEKTMRTTTPGEGAPLQFMPTPLDPGTISPPPGGLPAGVVRRRLALASGFGFALSALALSWPEIDEITRESSGVQSILQTLVLWITNWAPAVILIGFLVAAPRSRVFRAFVVVWIVGVILAVAMPGIARLIGGRPLDADLAMNGYWFTIALALNALPSLVMVFLTGRPRIRNVMPLVLALVVLLSLALTFFDYWLKVSVSDSGNVNSLLRWAVGTFGATIGPAVLFLLLSLPVGAVGWWAIGRIGARYEARKFSDTQLIVDAWWGVVIALHLVTLWRYGGPVAVGVCVVAFVLYLAGGRFALALLRLGGRKSGPSLLLLRVFGFQQRTERLFDTVAARWRFEGAVAMIAGGDLALRSIDAGEALAFARGDIASGYVGDAAKLAERLCELAGGPDPDGRYRVTEFFCYENTWRATLQALVARSSVVLMDLRGFTKANAGCVFELQQLAAAGRLDNCVFVTDDASDRTLAANALGAQANNPPRWVPVRRLEGEAMKALWDRLTEVARR